MHNEIRPNDLILLNEDVPQHTLVRGRIGRVLDFFAPDQVYIEFVDRSHRTPMEVQLSLEQFTVLRHTTTLDEDAFWKLIEAAKAESGGDGERQVQLLEDMLAAMSIADIFAFGEVLHHLKDVAYYRELWTAANIIYQGCGNDDFTDFRAWLIAQGRQVFYNALRDPETLADVVPVIDDEFGRRGEVALEPMNYVDYYAYEKKTGEEMPIFGGLYPYLGLRGEWWDEATIARNYPKLMQKFRPNG